MISDAKLALAARILGEELGASVGLEIVETHREQDGEPLVSGRRASRLSAARSGAAYPLPAR